MKSSVKYIICSVYSSAFALLPVSYLAVVANFGTTEALLATAALKLLPIVLIQGIVLGIISAYAGTHGCLLIPVAGISAIIGASATALSVSSQTPIGIIPSQAYVRGITIGVLVGAFVILLPQMITRIKGFFHLLFSE